MKPIFFPDMEWNEESESYSITSFRDQNGFLIAPKPEMGTRPDMTKMLDEYKLDEGSQFIIVVRSSETGELVIYDAEITQIIHRDEPDIVPLVDFRIVMLEDGEVINYIWEILESDDFKKNVRDDPG